MLKYANTARSSLKDFWSLIASPFQEHHVCRKHWSMSNEAVLGACPGVLACFL